MQVSSASSRRRALALLSTAFAWPALSVRAASQVNVAVAANLRYAMQELAALFEQATAIRIALSVGASGSLLQQIRSGAPFELYMSADEQFVLELAKQGLGANGPADQGVVHSLGGLALCWHHKALGPTPISAWREFLAATPKLAIANPEHAPYGRAALQWLDRIKLAHHVRARLVLGDSASQALQFVSSGAAPCGLLPISLALAAPARAYVRSMPLAHLPGNPWLPVLQQRMLLLRGASDQARKFYDWLQQAQAQEVLRRHGFELP
jgi:molybdate transport system substrate-binding protein